MEEEIIFTQENSIIAILFYNFFPSGVHFAWWDVYIILWSLCSFFLWYPVCSQPIITHHVTITTSSHLRQSAGGKLAGNVSYLESHHYIIQSYHASIIIHVYTILLLCLHFVLVLGKFLNACAVIKPNSHYVCRILTVIFTSNNSSNKKRIPVGSMFIIRLPVVHFMMCFLWDFP